MFNNMWFGGVGVSYDVSNMDLGLGLQEQTIIVVFFSSIICKTNVASC